MKESLKCCDGYIVFVQPVEVIDVPFNSLSCGVLSHGGTAFSKCLANEVTHRNDVLSQLHYFRVSIVNLMAESNDGNYLLEDTHLVVISLECGPIFCKKAFRRFDQTILTIVVVGQRRTNCGGLCSPCVRQRPLNIRLD